MATLKRIGLLLALLLSGLLAQAQTARLSGVVNHYVSIDSIYTRFDNNDDSLIVESVNGFSVGDTVMVYVVKGAKYNPSDADDENVGIPQLPDPGFVVGRYAFLIIKEIEASRRLIVLNAAMTDLTTFEEGDVAQLIRVPSYRHALVETGGVTAPGWNGSTGGVVALFVQRSLTLNGDIDVSGKGFRGAVSSNGYPGDCSSVNPGLYDSLYYHKSSVLAGRKGEGITESTWVYTRGRARNVNGGGGGNGLFSGGGGGGNYSFGGAGGYESATCDLVGTPSGIGGYNLYDQYFYVPNNSQKKNRLAFGGGGGSSVSTGSGVSSPGGDGGGLIVIVADSIIGNGNYLRADGESVSGNATGGGGGGGGGGGIVLDVNGYGNSLNLSAVGGNGGSTTGTEDKGPGGGGGGGFYWLSAGDCPMEVSADVIRRGLAGKSLANGVNFGATNGGRAACVYDLAVPILGFMFNSIPDGTTVCSDIIPDPLVGSVPKGGTGVPSYQWIDSTVSHTWQPVTVGNPNAKDLVFNKPLSETTHFKRIVSRALLDPDTSFFTTYTVQPAITGNTISASDTVCKGNAPEAFVGTGTLAGGDGIYSYRWQKDTGLGYGDAEGSILASTYTAPGLTEDTYFARVVRSGVCTDTSSAVFVKVWDQISNNTILRAFDTICQGVQPGLLPGEVHLGGDQDDFRFRWDSATSSAGPWYPVGAATRDYAPGPVVQTSYFRRVIYSGSDDACVSVSDFIRLNMLSAITGNTISASQVVCENSPVAPLSGSGPGGGNGSFNYIWQDSTASGNWQTAPGDPNQPDYSFPSGGLSETTWYRRVARSGGPDGDVCIQPSEALIIDVIPLIKSNTLSKADATKCQFEEVGIIEGSTPTDGSGTYAYRWEESTGSGGPGTWNPAPGINDREDYSGPEAASALDRFYRRIVESGPEGMCKDTTDVLQIVVHTAITNNAIDTVDAACFGHTKLLKGLSTPVGEGGLLPGFTWQIRNNGNGSWNDLAASNTEEYEAGPFNDYGEYYFRRIAHIGVCDDVSADSMRIRVMQVPGASLTDSSYHACEQDTKFYIKLDIDEAHPYLTPWVLTLKNGRDTNIGPFSLEASDSVEVSLATTLDTEILNYQIESLSYGSTGLLDFNCVAPAGRMTGSKTIEVFRSPEPQIMVDAVARDSFKVCDTIVALRVEADNGLGSWLSEPGGQVVFSPSDSDEDIRAFIPDQHEAYGKYLLTFKSEAGGCYGIDSIEIHYFEQPEPAYAGTDTSIFLKNKIYLKADSATAGMGTWALVEGQGSIEEPHNPNTLAYDLGLGQENTFRWTVTNGEDEGTCTSSSDVMIVIRNEVQRYGGFSPGGGDNINEYYIMQGLKYADSYRFTVFNAIGGTVYDVSKEDLQDLEVDPAMIMNGLKRDETVVWDGRSGEPSKANRSLVPSGTYYYVLQYQKEESRKTNEYEFTGTIVVVRE